MKRLSLIVLALLLAGVLSVGSALAADSFTVTVNAEVIDSCKVIENGVLDFPQLDPINDTGLVTATVTTAPQIACTSGTEFTLAAVGGTARSLTGPDSIPYTLTVPGDTFTGAGSLAITINDFGAEIADGAYQNKPAGEYDDVVTININFL